MSRMVTRSSAQRPSMVVALGQDELLLIIEQLGELLEYCKGKIFQKFIFPVAQTCKVLRHVVLRYFSGKVLHLCTWGQNGTYTHEWFPALGLSPSERPKYEALTLPSLFLERYVPVVRTLSLSTVKLVEPLSTPLAVKGLIFGDVHDETTRGRTALKPMQALRRIATVIDLSSVEQLKIWGGSMYGVNQLPRLFPNL